MFAPMRDRPLRQIRDSAIKNVCHRSAPFRLAVLDHADAWLVGGYAALVPGWPAAVESTAIPAWSHIIVPRILELSTKVGDGMKG